MAGRLRGFMMSLRNLEYPVWSCRLSMSNYPLKISWCGAETDTFYVAVAFGIVVWPRIKIARISSIGSGDTNTGEQVWKVKYGLKYDPQQLHANGGLSLWSVACTIQYANEFTLRLPIQLWQSSTTPVAWVGSILIAEFVDQQLKHIQWNDGTTYDIDIPFNVHKRSSNSYHPCLPKVVLDTYRHVANKKRVDESNKPDGLVILQATLTFRNSTEAYDIKDTLQFWVVNSQLNMPFSDARLLWQVGDRIHKQDTEKSEQTLWNWIFLFPKRQPIQSEKIMEDISTVDIRYQYNEKTYQLAFHGPAGVDDTSGTDVGRAASIQLPSINAMELGPSNRVR